MSSLCVPNLVPLHSALLPVKDLSAEILCFIVSVNTLRMLDHGFLDGFALTGYQVGAPAHAHKGGQKSFSLQLSEPPPDEKKRREHSIIGILRYTKSVILDFTLDTSGLEHFFGNIVLF